MARIYVLDRPPLQLGLMFPGHRTILTGEGNEIVCTRRAIVRVTDMDKQMQGYMDCKPGGYNSISMHQYDDKFVEAGAEIGVSFLYANSKEMIKGTHPSYFVERSCIVHDRVIDDFQAAFDPLRLLISQYGKQRRMLQRKLTKGETHSFEDIEIQPILDLEKLLKAAIT